MENLITNPNIYSQRHIGLNANINQRKAECMLNLCFIALIVIFTFPHYYPEWSNHKQHVGQMELAF